MTDPLSFTSATPRFALPFLFAGQAQKEFFVNEAHARLDVLLHAAVSGEASEPPADPVDGDCWLVGAAATGDWSGQDGALAGRQGGAWTFVTPSPGMRLYDASTGQLLLYSGEWRRSEAPAAPTGGAVVDSEARDTLATLIEALTAAGVFPTR